MFQPPPLLLGFRAQRISLRHGAEDADQRGFRPVQVAQTLQQWDGACCAVWGRGDGKPVPKGDGR